MEISGNLPPGLSGLGEIGTTDFSASAGAGKVSPDGKAFTSMMMQGMMENAELQRKLFDPVKEAVDEGKDE